MMSKVLYKTYESRICRVTSGRCSLVTTDLVAINVVREVGVEGDIVVVVE